MLISETVTVALITVIGTVLVALMDRTRRHAKATREQTENQHSNTPTPNLRDNIDANQLETNKKLNRMAEILDGVVDTQRRQGNKLDRLFSIVGRHDEKFDILEDTVENKNRVN